MKSKLFSPQREPRQQNPLHAEVKRFVNTQDVPRQSGGHGMSAVQQMTHMGKKNVNHA